MIRFSFLYHVFSHGVTLDFSFSFFLYFQFLPKSSHLGMSLPSDLSMPLPPSNLESHDSSSPVPPRATLDAVCGSDLTIPCFSEGRKAERIHGVRAERRLGSTRGAHTINKGLHGIQSHVSKGPLGTFSTTFLPPRVRPASLHCLPLQ